MPYFERPPINDRAENVGGERVARVARIARLEKLARVKRVVGIISK
jgi:hypothetical protein